LFVVLKLGVFTGRSKIGCEMGVWWFLKEKKSLGGAFKII